MERITAKEVTSMMQAVAQVYEQPEVEQLDEVSGNPVMPSDVRDEARKRLKNKGKTDAEIDKIFADMDAPASEQRRAQVERDRLIQQAGGGVAGEKAATERLKNNPLRFLFDIEARGKADVRTKGREALKQLGDGDIELGLKRFREKQAAAADTKPTDTNTKPTDTEPTDTKPTDTNTKPTDTNTKPTDTKPATPQEKAYGSRSSLNKDQQAVNREYDRLRKSDPEAAAAYGKKMAARGAANKNFKLEKPTQAQSNPTAAQKQASVDAAIKSVNTPEKMNRQAPAGTALRAQQDRQAAAKSPAPSTTGAKPRAQVRGREAMMAAQRDRAATPAVKAPATPAAKPAGSIAQRLQAIRDMRAASQSRIAAQGGTPATPAANPTPKATPPSTTGATTTPTVKPAAKVEKKQPLKNGDPMERMTGKGAASLMETYSKVYEEREPQAIDEGIMGALAKVGAKEISETIVLKTGPDGKPVFPPKKGGPTEKEEPKKGGYQLPKRTPANAKNVEYYKDDADLFDIIKGHFIGEGLTEEEALTKMLDLTDEERTEILEGIIGQTADNIARTAGTVVGNVQRGAGYLKQKVKNVKGTFDAARERASSNNPDVRSGRMVRITKNSEPVTKN